MHKSTIVRTATLSVGLLATAAVSAQQTSLTLRQAVERAVHNYPSISVSQAQIDAASAGIQLARTAYLPRLDSIAQVNRATRNNVFGLLFPQSVIPSVSGPVLETDTSGTVWGSAVGATVTWEPFDFGLRSAGVSAATAAKSRSEATLKRTEFEISVAAADAFLTVAAAQETVRAAQAAVDRAQSLSQVVRAQADAQLRPGADASRAEAELAAARTQLAQSEQARDVARALLSQFVGIPPGQIDIATGNLLIAPSANEPSTFNPAQNPIAAEQSAVVEQKKADLQVLEKSYVPKFVAQGSAFARGTGALTNGDRLGGLNGLAPDTPNYALGFSITFPVFDRAAVQAREAVASAAVRAESERYRQITTELTSRKDAATAALAGARKIAANTPVAVSAATATNQQAGARYQSGLGTIVEVADAQRLLTQAEIDDSLARLGVWRAMLSVAAASGDIEPFISNIAP